MEQQDRSWTLSTALREWQLRALDLWRANSDHGTVSVVTGAGKTMLALACLADLHARRPELRSLIVLPTVQLLEQWRVALEAHLGLRNDTVALIGGGYRGRIDRAVTLAVANSARRLSKGFFRSDQWALIADECHHLGSRENSLILHHVEYSATLGLSATPFRQYDQAFEEIIAPVLGPVIFALDYESAVNMGLLVPFQLWNVRVPLTANERQQFDRMDRAIAREMSELHQAGVRTSERLKMLLFRRKRTSHSVRSRLPAAAGVMESFRGRRTLLFHESIPAAESLYRTLAGQGYRVRLYHSRMTPPARYESLLLFQTGQVDALVTCRALDEGFDIPAAEAGVLVASSNSGRQRIQRIGRVLRPFGHKDSATVVSLYALNTEAELLRRESERLEGVSRVRWLEATGP